MLCNSCATKQKPNVWRASGISIPWQLTPYLGLKGLVCYDTSGKLYKCEQAVKHTLTRFSITFSMKILQHSFHDVQVDATLKNLLADLLCAIAEVMWYREMLCLLTKNQFILGWIVTPTFPWGISSATRLVLWSSRDHSNTRLSCTSQHLIHEVCHKNKAWYCENKVHTGRSMNQNCVLTVVLQNARRHSYNIVSN